MTMKATKRNIPVSRPAMVASAYVFMRSSLSGVLHDDAFEHLGHVLTPVDGRLHPLVDLQPLDDFDRVLLLGEEPLDGALRGAVPVLLELLDPLDVLADALARLE